MATLTPQQQKALDFKRHLSVTANAGAGKTTVLVQRFLEILLRTRTRVNEIVAITFTEKAANELRKKIAESVDRRIREAGSQKERHAFERIRDQLSSAVIGTIHSFCAQLLRSYPIEADVDAAFTVLEGFDQRFLREEALKESFEAIMTETGAAEDRESLLSLVRAFGRHSVQQDIHVLLEKREQVERLLDGVFSYDNDAILAHWKQLLVDKADEQLYRKEWVVALQNILARSSGPIVQHLSAVLGAINSGADMIGKVHRCSSELNLVFTKENTLRKKFIGPGQRFEPAAADLEALILFRKEVARLSDELLNPEAIAANPNLLTTTKTLLQIYRRCLAVYERKKSEYGMLDFEDLQLKTRSLLRSAGIRRRLTEKYKFIMIDEFQDTNRLQYEIVLSLVDNYSGSNLFIVGDPKQSIYGFRNAEVEVFERARKEIVSFPSVVETLSAAAPEEQGGAIVLSESFRPLPNLIAFVNSVFARLLDVRASISYDELIQGRDSFDEQGIVELLLVPPGDEEAASEHNDAVTDECRMIARRLVQLKESQHGILNAKTGIKEPFDFGGAAVLLRSRRHVREIERAFLEFNIPYALLGGIGFFQTQEVNDLLNYFKFLLHQGDDVALVGILRSPFFAISDAEIFEISLAAKGEAFWDKLIRYVSKSKSSSHVRRAVEILSDNIIHAQRLTIPLLAERIFRQTAWHGTISGLVPGAQYAANIKKLLRMAREFEAKGFTTLFDFIERLKTLVANQEREGQASLHAAGDSVQVMTIHSAKGLEFPVVFLPFLHKNFQYDQPPFVDADVGIGLRMSVKAGGGEGSIPAIARYLEHKSRQKTEEEEKRVFYVACTRARDALILSASDQKQSPKSSCLTWLRESLGKDFDTEGMALFDPLPIRVLHRLDGSYQTQTTMHQLALNVCFPSGEQSGAIEATRRISSPSTPSEILVEPLSGRISGEFFSATQIKTYLDCPTKYLLKYVLGVPEQNTPLYPFDENEEPNDKIDGQIEGIVTHAVLQELDRLPVGQDEIKEKILRLIESDNGDGAITSHRLDAMVRNILKFVHSDFGTEILSSPESRCEASITQKFDEDFLMGTIDRLYRKEGGEWNIVDYKTDRVDAATLRARADTYLPQLSFYACLVSKLFTQSSVRASLVFLEHADKPIHYDFTPEKLGLFANDLRSVISKIKSSDFRREKPLCDMCPYKHENKCLISLSGIS